MMELCPKFCLVALLPCSHKVLIKQSDFFPSEKQLAGRDAEGWCGARD